MASPRCQISRRQSIFAFRLRQLLGVGARAEAARFLLTVRAPSVTAQVVTESAGYAKRNIHEALAALHWAGVRVPQGGRLGAECWQDFVDLVEAAVTSVS